MSINSKYNGWPAVVRKFRGKKFYSMMHQGKIPKPVKCAACGATGGGMTYHAEQYGPTWEEYVEGAKPLCNYCHGMMHMRFRFPNRFKRYLKRISEGYTFTVFSNLGEFFNIANKFNDIDYQEYYPSGVEWLDKINRNTYTGNDKVAIALLPDGTQIPDPKIYTMVESKKITEEWNEASN